MELPNDESRRLALIVFGVKEKNEPKTDAYYQALEYFAESKSSWRNFITSSEYRSVMSIEELRDWHRSIMGPETRKVENSTDEYTRVMKKCEVTRPHRITNNQRSMTKYFDIDEKKYTITYFEDETWLEEILE